MDEQAEEVYSNDDEDFDDHSHKKLLNAVSQIYTKQRIALPKRNEPSQQISEFNLSKSERKRKVGAEDLVKALNKKAAHHQITKRVKSIKSKVKPLPKQLEKFQAEKISRQMGYNAIKTELWKYEPVIQKNRAADQLVFPLKDSRMKFERDANFLTTFTKPSELELKMANMLKVSLQAEEGKAEEDYDKMTLDEVLKRRQAVAKMRARESYRITKAVRQNKIKSKKYHRLLKREKIKQELKEFELLQKTDPEAAMAKLERIEKARAEERISLRHRNTGKWAKGLALRAKYDGEARAQLEENLRKSRELTQKMKTSMGSDSEEEEDAVGLEEAAPNQSGNPWISQKDDEITSFVSGYRKFWETQNQKSEPNSKTDESLAKLVTNESESGGSPKSPLESRDEEIIVRANGESESNEAIGSTVGDGDFSVESAPVETIQNRDHTKCNSPGTTKTKENESSNSSVDVLHNGITTSNSDSSSETNSFGQLHSYWKTVVESAFVEFDETCPKPETKKLKSSVSKRKGKLQKQNSPKQPATLTSKCGQWSVSNDNSPETNSHEKKLPSDADSTKHSPKVKNKKRKIEHMFEKVEDSISEALPKKIAAMQSRLKKNTKSVNIDKTQNPTTPEYMDLSFKKSELSQVDESLVESVQEHGAKANDTKAFADILKASVQPEPASQSTDIDPTKFIPVKTQRLKTAVPHFEQGGDSESEEEEQQHVNLMEAFADDDIADEFQKEKEAEEAESQPKELDLTLPGWGSWGGSGIMKKKKDRRIVKFPRVKRKDDDKKHVIINEDVFSKFRSLQPTDLPPQIQSVASYEAIIRAPIGDTFVPQTAHSAFVAPRVVTKMGQIIEPMDQSVLLDVKEKEEKLAASLSTKTSRDKKKKGGSPNVKGAKERKKKGNGVNSEKPKVAKEKPNRRKNVKTSREK